MAYRTYKRRATRNYRRLPYRKVQYQRARPLYRRRRAFRRFQYKRNRTTQNNVKFTSINFFSERLVWPYAGQYPAPITPVTHAHFEFTMAALIKQNYQFLRNLIDYHYVKINYIAFKCLNMTHIGYEKDYRQSETERYSIGVTAFQGDIPCYVCWDLEQDLEKLESNQNFAELISQYQFSKRWNSKSKTGPTFLYRTPIPYRQFFKTDNFKSTDFKLVFPEFMAKLSGVQNIRAPSKMHFAIKDFWNSALPGQTDRGTYILTNLEGKVYLGCTFRGRRLMDTGVTSSIPHSLVDEFNQNLESKENELQDLEIESEVNSHPL